MPEAAIALAANAAAAAAAPAFCVTMTGKSRHYVSSATYLTRCVRIIAAYIADHEYAAWPMCSRCARRAPADIGELNEIGR